MSDSTEINTPVEVLLDGDPTYSELQDQLTAARTMITLQDGRIGELEGELRCQLANAEQGIIDAVMIDWEVAANDIKAALEGGE